MFIPVLFLLFSFLSLASSQGYIQQGFTWSSQYQSGNAPWLGRYGASAAITSSGALLLIGGVVYSPNATPPYTLFNDVQQSINDGLTFIQPAPIAPFSPRFFHSSALTSAGSVLLIGGVTYDSKGNQNLLLDTWYTNDGVTWTQGSQMPWGRGRCAHAVSADTLSLIFYVTAGYIVPSQVLNDVWKTPDAGITWQIATINGPWTARAFHGLIVRQSTVFLIGGATYSSNTWIPCNDVWISVDQGTTWTQLSAAVPFSNRIFSSIIGYNNDDMFVIAGVSVPSSLNPLYIPPSSSSTVYSDVWESTDAGLSWQQTNPTSVFGPRYSSPVIILGQDLTLLGGVSQNQTYLNDVWMTVLPLDSTDSSGTILAAIIGSLSGVLILLIVVMRRLQDKFAKPGQVMVSGKTEQQLAQQTQQESRAVQVEDTDEGDEMYDQEEEKQEEL